ncbi:MAG: transporter substrate-binding domain-containing protein [Cellvibrio sp.]|uniref:hypothetical protein n=1 Tax=Cellvibrio sp. TaxID=1965322 RepID=UPI0031A5E976
MKIFLLIVLLLFGSVAVADGSPMIYRYWDLGISAKRDQYQFELLRLALDKTRATHGEYQLIRADQKIAAIRASREVSHGELINIEATPDWATEVAPSALRNDKRIAVKIPLMHNLLGYRRLVIRKSDVQKFEAITQPSQLKKLVAGQGRDWEDSFIYRANGYSVNSQADYYNLFSMLVAGRFDYIPLGVMEVDDFLKQFGKHSFDVTIAPNILIYYPFPVLFQVSIKHPELAERVEKGLAVAKQDGSMQRLFDSYFSNDVKKLRSSKNRVFILENKRVPVELRMDEPVLINK